MSFCRISRSWLPAAALLAVLGCGPVTGDGNQSAIRPAETYDDPSVRPARSPCDRLGEPSGSLRLLPHRPWPAGLRGRHLQICFDQGASNPDVSVTPPVYEVEYSCTRPLPGLLDCILERNQIPLFPETNYLVTVTAADGTTEQVWMGDHPNALRPGEFTTATVCEHLAIEAAHWPKVECYERETGRTITGKPAASVAECITDDDAILRVKDVVGTDLGVYRVYTSTAYIPSLANDVVVANGGKVECTLKN